jgi:hypothetical protein
VFLDPVGRTNWTADQSISRPLPTHIATQHNEHIQMSLPAVGLEITSPIFELAKIALTLGRSTTVMSKKIFVRFKVAMARTIRMPSYGMWRSLVLVSTFRKNL